MAHFTVTRDVIRRISEIETPHACALNEDISDEFPNDACAAYTLAVGFSVAPCWVRSAMLPSGRTRSMASMPWCIARATR
jgi:hypothetical protein